MFAALLISMKSMSLVLRNSAALYNLGSNLISVLLFCWFVHLRVGSWLCECLQLQVTVLLFLIRDCLLSQSFMLLGGIFYRHLFSVD